MTWILLLFANFCFANETLYRSIEVSEIEFSEFQKQSNFTSPLQQHDNELQNSEMKKNLERLFVIAQSSFLEMTAPEAILTFQKVTALAYSEDWSADQRQMIRHAFLRLAQLDLPNRKSDFAQLNSFDDEYKPDAELFSPDLIRELEESRADKVSANQKISWSLSTEMKLFDQILINGRVYSLRSINDIQLSPRNNRITLLSNAFAEQSLTADAEHIMSWKPALIPFVVGDCENAQLAKGSQEKWVALFKNNCLAHLSKVASLNASLDLQPVTKIQDINANNLWPTSQGLAATTRTDSEMSSSTTHWFWWGLAAVAAVSLYENQNSHKEAKTVPSHRSGF